MALSKIPSAGFQDNVKFRNIIINGDMSIAQRSTSVSGITGSGYNTCDRWRVFLGSLGTWTQSQSTDVPTGQGFSSSLKMDCTTADASPSASDELIVAQSIEGQNLQYLKFGTSSAESLTVSFWVKSNKTGTYICELFHEEGSNDKTINKSYTIDSANTWEKKTITFAGDTAKAFDNDNALTLNLSFWLGAGSNFTSGTLATSWETRTNANRAVGQVNLADSTSNEWYITGVQLEAGQTASEFEFLPVDVQLNRCKRYFQKFTSSGDEFLSFHQSKRDVNDYICNIPLENEMRSSPSFTSNFVSNHIHKRFVAYESFTVTGSQINKQCVAVKVAPASDHKSTISTCYGRGGSFELNAEL
jgi:hypothetical protein